MYATSAQVLEIGGGRVKSNHSYEDLFPNRHTYDIDPKRQPDTVGDAHALPFSDGSFEFILCTEVLEHLHTPQKAIDEMCRVLKSGGTLIITTRFVFPIHDAPHDYYRYTEYGLRHLFRDWKIIELKAETESFSAIGALMQRLGFQSDLKGGKFTKMLLYFFAFIFERLNWVIQKEYGDITKKSRAQNIFTTGYYLVCSKE
jgi:SAM-dependent methyltransferase